MERYAPKDILQILTDFYNCQAAFDPEVSPGQTLSFETTISEWMDICDLVAPAKLAKVYHEMFDLNTPVAELETILFDGKNTLSDFCNYLSVNAIRTKILPIKIMGTDCMTAAIFKVLVENLRKKGITDDIKPSSKIDPLFKKYGGILLSEVNLIAPGAFTNFEYSENLVLKAGLYCIFLFFVSTAIVLFKWHFFWLLLTPLIAGALFICLGSKLKPRKEVIGGYDTMKDLILGMQSKLQ
jgi:hypothetical protein